MEDALYLRVSTEEQRERQSIATQREFAERYCALHHGRCRRGTTPCSAGNKRGSCGTKRTAPGKDASLAVMLMGLAGLVLLVACANLANLLLSRPRTRLPDRSPDDDELSIPAWS